MKKVFLFSFAVFIGIFLTGCSSSEKTTEEGTNKNSYVFDEIPSDTTITVSEPVVVEPASLNVKYYLVQVGAFTTKKRAEEFAEESRKKLNRKVSITFSNNINLFVVQLTPLFTTRQEAESIRNELWKTDDFKDAWIVTVTK